MTKINGYTSSIVVVGLCILIGGSIGCSPKKYRERADSEVEEIIRIKQLQVKGTNEPFTIETPADTLRRRLMIDQGLPFTGNASLGSDLLLKVPDWPEEDQPSRLPSSGLPFTWEEGLPLKLTLEDALMVAAANNRDYQTRKEDIFQLALGLDLERDVFRNTFYGALESEYISNQSGDINVSGVANRATARWSRVLKYGAALSSQIFIDLVKLLTPGSSSSRGLYADATISIPLLAGSGKNIVTEPLIQAERDVLYSMYTFERFKRSLAVQIATEYLSVLRQENVLNNAEENYKRLKSGTTRAERMAEAGRLSKVELDQARQDVLRARNSWILAAQAYANRLDSFKVSMGLPPDSLIGLDRSELEQLDRAAADGMDADLLMAQVFNQNGDGEAVVQPGDMPEQEDDGLLALSPEEAIRLALTNRLDMRVAKDRVTDAQRKVVVAADALRAGLTLSGSAQYGERRGIESADLPDAELRPNLGVYSLGILLDLPWERTEEQNFYRNSYIVLERQVRNVQELEDQIKIQVRDALRTLAQTKESYQIQTLAEKLARQRVDSAALFLQAGRAQVRDVLEAQDDYVSAQNARIAALVDYRIAELGLQRDMGVIEVDHRGIWSEYRP